MKVSSWFSLGSSASGSSASLGSAGSGSATRLPPARGVDSLFHGNPRE